MTVYKALTLAGSDSSGGAGLQADLKTFQEYEVYGMTAITTIVAQDPNNGWFHNVYPIEIGTIRAQLETILAGIGIDAMKTGMLGSIEVIDLAAEVIEQYGIANVVVDPVMVCKGADEPLHPELNERLRDVLVPKALVVTPNLFEASQLSGLPRIQTIDDMKEAAARIHESGAKYVIVKGGAKLGTDKAVDVLYDGRNFEVLESDRIETTYTHGAGCTYSAAIAAALARGQAVRDAIESAKVFITEAIRRSFPLNQYVGPTYHAACRSRFAKQRA